MGLLINTSNMEVLKMAKKKPAKKAAKKKPAQKKKK
jgi:hypothetical protein